VECVTPNSQLKVVVSGSRSNVNYVATSERQIDATGLMPYTKYQIIDSSSSQFREELVAEYHVLLENSELELCALMTNQSQFCQTRHNFSALGYCLCQTS